VIVVARTSDAPGAKGISLLLVEAERAGFHRGRKLEKLGQHSADTSELFLDDIEVPRESLLGPEGGGFVTLMRATPARKARDSDHVNGGSPACVRPHLRLCPRSQGLWPDCDGFPEHARHKLADLHADLCVGWAFVDQCLDQHLRGALDSKHVSIAKLWCSGMQGRLVDQCLQFFGGYGFMREYEICRLYAVARVQRIYDGTSEIMRELIGRSLAA
jgi:acyl-CoA dehydrogenase